MLHSRLRPGIHIKQHQLTLHPSIRKHLHTSGMAHHQIPFGEPGSFSGSNTNLCTGSETSTRQITHPLHILCKVRLRHEDLASWHSSRKERVRAKQHLCLITRLPARCTSSESFHKTDNQASKVHKHFMICPLYSGLDWRLRLCQSSSPMCCCILFGIY